MKKKSIIQIITFYVLGILMNACSDKTDEVISTKNIEDGVPVTLSVGTKALPDNLECDLYVYRKLATESDYALAEIIPFGTENKKLLKFTNKDLKENLYRFFFIATVSGNSEISMQNIAINSLWKELGITANQKNLSDNWYYDIITKTGDQIIREGEINAYLERLVGQITLDIFRAEGGIDSPIDIINKADVASVLDRVYQIDMVYSGLTKKISFEENGDIVEKEIWGDDYLVTIAPEMNEALQVSLPQMDKGLEISGKKTDGSVRILGVCGLPATKQARVISTFYYYDTTPICQLNKSVHQGDHMESCFLQKEIILNLPKLAETENLLTIYPNTYTVNNAGILFDRIIDIGIDGSTTFDVVWNINNQ